MRSHLGFVLVVILRRLRDWAVSADAVAKELQQVLVEKARQGVAVMGKVV